MKYLFLSASQRAYNQTTTGESSTTSLTARPPQKEKSDISIGDVINKNGKTKKRSSIRKMINPQKSLRARLCLCFCVTSLTFAICLLATTVLSTNKLILSENGKSLIALAQSTSDKISMGMYEIVAHLSALAGSLVFQLDPDVDSLKIAGKSITQIAYLRTLLINTHLAYQYYISISYAYTNGSVCVSSDPKMEGRNFGNREWFKSALRSPGVSMGIPPETLETPNIIIDLAIPVRNKTDGSLLGALLVMYNWNWARDMDQSFMAYKNLDFYIFDWDLHLILAPREESYNGSARANLPWLSDFMASNETNEHIQTDLFFDAQQPDKQISKGLVVGMAKCADTRGMNNSNWVVVLTLPKNEARSLTVTLRNRIILFSAIFWVVLCGTGWWIASQIVHPLTRTSQFADILMRDNEKFNKSMSQEFEVPDVLSLDESFRTFSGDEADTQLQDSLLGLLKNQHVAQTTYLKDEVYTLCRSTELLMHTLYHQRLLTLKLEQVVAERTKGLREEVQRRKDMQKSAEEAQRTAEAAEAAKSRFLANMSHEIRTPMNGILGTLLLLLDTKLLGEQVDYVMTMKHCADSLLCIINDVLMYSKLEADKLQLDASIFQIEDVCEGVGKLLGPLAAAKSVDMYFLVDPAVPALCIGDPGRLRQVLINLVGNSVKFTDIGGEIMVICSISCTTCYLRKVLGATRDSPYQHGGGDHECFDAQAKRQIAAQENSAKTPQIAVTEEEPKTTPKADGGEEKEEKEGRKEKGSEEAPRLTREGSNQTPKKKNSSTKVLSEFAEAVKSKMKGAKDKSAEGSANSSRSGSVTESLERNAEKNEGERAKVKGIKGEGSASSSRSGSVSEGGEKSSNEGEKTKGKGQRAGEGGAGGGGSRAGSVSENSEKTGEKNPEGEKMSARTNSETETRKPNRSDLSVEGGNNRGMGYKVHSRAASSNEAEEAYKRNLLASTESGEFVSPRKLAQSESSGTERLRRHSTASVTGRRSYKIIVPNNNNMPNGPGEDEEKNWPFKNKRSTSLGSAHAPDAGAHTSINCYKPGAVCTCNLKKSANSDSSEGSNTTGSSGIQKPEDRGAKNESDAAANLSPKSTPSPRTEETQLIRFEVRDNGCGISQEQIGRLFTPFFQADNSTTRVKGGTGLGLSICKQIVELFGGTTHVQSTLNAGASFQFTARFASPPQPTPVAESVQATAQPAQPPASNSTPRTPSDEIESPLSSPASSIIIPTEEMSSGQPSPSSVQFEDSPRSPVPYALSSPPPALLPPPTPTPLSSPPPSSFLTPYPPYLPAIPALLPPTPALLPSPRAVLVVPSSPRAGVTFAPPSPRAFSSLAIPIPDSAPPTTPRTTLSTSLRPPLPSPRSQRSVPAPRHASPMYNITPLNLHAITTRPTSPPALNLISLTHPSPTPEPIIAMSSAAHLLTPRNPEAFSPPRMGRLRSGIATPRSASSTPRARATSVPPPPPIDISIPIRVLVSSDKLTFIHVAAQSLASMKIANILPISTSEMGKSLARTFGSGDYSCGVFYFQNPEVLMVNCKILSNHFRQHNKKPIPTIVVCSMAANSSVRKKLHSLGVTVIFTPMMCAKLNDTLLSVLASHNIIQDENNQYKNSLPPAPTTPLTVPYVPSLVVNPVSTSTTALPTSPKQFPPLNIDPTSMDMAHPLQRISSSTNEKKNAMRVLAVEDNPINMKILKKYLERMETVVTFASDGLEAVEAVQAKPVNFFDLVFMDLHMPHMDGMQATAEIRKWEEEQCHAQGFEYDQGVTIVALTADVLPGTMEACTAAGMDGYISKPIDYNQLLAKVEEVKLKSRKR